MRTAPALLLLLLIVWPSPATGGERTIGLETAIGDALRNCKELEYARYDQRLAAARLKAGVRQFLPAVQIGYTASDSVTYDSADSRIRKLSLGLKQLLFDGGRLGRERKNQKEELALNEIVLRGTTEELILSVIDVYTDLLQYLSLIHI